MYCSARSEVENVKSCSIFRWILYSAPHIWRSEGWRDVAAKKKKKTVAKRRARKRNLSGNCIALSPDYRPSNREDFMGPEQQEYFRQKLLGWRREILVDSSQTITNLREESSQESDVGDRASTEAGRLIELRSRDRARKLLSKIEAALQRIKDGTYGYCEETGEPISLSRLEARPVATLSLAAQERHERLEKTYTDE